MQQRVTRLVHGGHAAVFFRHDEGMAGDTHQKLVAGFLEIARINLLLVLAGGEKGGLVHEVREIGAAHAGGRAREMLEVDARVERDFRGVNLEDRLAFLDVGHRDDDLPVEAAGAKERGIKNVGTVRRGEDDDAVFRLEAVHLDEHLVERLLALVVPAAVACAARPANRRQARQ